VIFGVNRAAADAQSRGPTSYNSVDTNVFAWDEKRTVSTAENMAFHLKRRRGSSKIQTSSLTGDRLVAEEERWHAIGCAGGIAILLVVHTSEEQHGEEEIRIISARKASPCDHARYYSYH
jgi:uncharacterized protein